MGEKRRRGGGDLLLEDMIGILVRQPIVSLLRFKGVCKSWLALIESSSFADLYFNSFDKFGSFILHAAVDFEKFREDAVFMLSSESESRSARYDSTCSWENFYIYVFNEQYSSVVGGNPWAYLSHFEIKKLGLPGERYIPRGISNDGVFALLETEIRGGLGNNNKNNNKKKKKKMKLYNLVTKQVKENFLSCDQVLSKAFPYKPSLVSFPYKAAAAATATADMVIGKAAECSSQPMIID